MSERRYYVLCEDNCKFESMTKQQILSAIRQAVSGGKHYIDVEEGLVDHIREVNHGRNISFWIGTQAEYNAITSREENVLYIISDDQYTEDLQTAVTNLQEYTTNVETTVNAAATKIAEYEGRLAIAEGQVSQAATDIDAAETDISSIQDDITEMQGDISTAENSISILNRKVGEAVTMVLLDYTDLSVATFNLSAAFLDFSKIIIETRMGNFYKTEIIYPALMSTNTFVIGMEYEVGSYSMHGGIKYAAHFSGSTFVCEAISAQAGSSVDIKKIKIVGII